MTNLEIIYEDNHLLVVIKPTNMLTQADDTGDPDMLSEMKEMIKFRDEKPGNVYLGLVHRLDRVVSGLIVFAKTSKAASRLSEQIRQRSFKKNYLAHVSGVPKAHQKKLIHYLKKDAKTNKVTVSDQDKTGFKKAILSYQVLDTDKHGSILEIELETGRAHQIRSQLSYIGHPIIGDTKYGFRYDANKRFKVNGIHLFSSQIELTHPTLQKHMTFTATPDWFKV